VTSLTADNFLGGATPCVVHFWAAWCGVSCVIQEQILRTLEEENPHLRFGKLNCDENPDVAADCDIIAIPTLIFYKDGKPVKRLVGLQEESALREIIKSI
jgi:thioredoxin 1